MHQHAFGADCVKRIVGKAQSLGVSHFEARVDVAASQAAICFGDQGLTEVDSSDETTCADLIGEVEGVRTYAATDVEDVRSWAEAELIYQRRFPPDNARLFVGRVEEAEKEIGVGCAIDSREAGYVQVGHSLQRDYSPFSSVFWISLSP